MTLLIQDVAIAFRPMEPGDVAYVAGTWLRSEQQLSRMRADRFRAWRRPIVHRHIQRDAVLVACSPDVPRTIYGWACHDGEVIIYAYVAHDMQRAGLGHALVRAVKEGAGHGREAASR